MPFIAGMIFSGSIGSVRIARLIQSAACSSMRDFSAAVMPPKTRLAFLKSAAGGKPRRRA
jgi:hypothetical protein